MRERNHKLINLTKFLYIFCYYDAYPTIQKLILFFIKKIYSLGFFDSHSTFNFSSAPTVHTK